MGLTLLSHASIPLHFWDHSFTTAVTLINKLPSSSLPNFTSPYFALHKTVPDYKSLRTFGCACFPFIRPYNQHKLQFRSIECVYLGPSPRHKGHKCLSSEGRIYISKDVLFDETSFPYTKLFPSLTAPSSKSSSLTFSSSIPIANTISPIVDPLSPSLSNVPSISSESTLAQDSVPNPAVHVPAESVSLDPPAATSTTTFNIHPMVTRGKTGNLKAKTFLAHVERSTVKQAVAQPHWLTAMCTEYTALLNNKTWTLVPLPPHRKPIGCKWVFRTQKKTRMVASINSKLVW